MSSARPELTASIVVVSHDSALRLPACLRSVRSFFDLDVDRVIVVDNASGDESLAVAAAECPEALIIANEENVGFARAVNQALAEARGDFVALVNPDVVSIEGSRTRLEELLADGSVAVVAPRLTDEQGALQRTCRTELTPWTMLAEEIALEQRLPGSEAARRHRMLDWDMSDERDVEEAIGALLFLSSEALAGVGGFDERFFLYYEETDWLRRAREVGLRVVYTPAIGAMHASGESSSESDEAYREALLAASMYLYLRKWYGRPAEIGVRLFMIAVDLIRALTGPLRGPEPRERARIARRRLRVDLGGSGRRGR